MILNIIQRKRLVRWYMKYGIMLDAVLMVWALTVLITYSVRVIRSIP